MGKKIQNYCLEQMIGEGQFGKVYKAINEKTQQVVAIKVIKIQKFKMSPKLEEFTINEIQTLSKIEDTTNIVKFIEILKTANNYYFVYDYCNGGTLEQEIKKDGNFTEEKAICYFKQLLKAFKMLVRNNIMHRDIKPSNILLHNGCIKLADFGFCKPLKDSRDLAQTMLGSPIYMAPEILKGQIYTMKADIWSLGVVLYEMLFGFCPFEEKTIAKLINLIDEKTVNFPTDIRISKKMTDLISRMLVKDHFKRINWDQIFDFDWTKQTQTTVPKASSNPFSKKQISNPYQQQYQSQSTGYGAKTLKANPTALTAVNQNYSNNQPQSYSHNQASIQSYSTNPNPKFRKVESGPQVDVQRQKLQKRQMRKLLDMRSMIFKGLKMVDKLINQSGSKLSVHICCFLMGKVGSLSKQLYENANKVFKEKQNYSIMGSQLRKLINIVIQQKMQLGQKIVPFEKQLKNIVEPQDIIYLRFAELQCLTQQKDGLIQLLQIDDFFQGLLDSYSQYSKKELLEQYQKRVMRKS